MHCVHQVLYLQQVNPGVFVQEEAWLPLPDKKKNNRTWVTQRCQHEYKLEKNYFSKHWAKYSAGH